MGIGVSLGDLPIREFRFYTQVPAFAYEDSPIMQRLGYLATLPKL